MTDFDAIIKLIKILAHPHTMLILPINVCGRTFDGIRLSENNIQDYELFVDVTDRYNTLESIEEVYLSSFLSESDELYIKNLLESYL